MFARPADLLRMIADQSYPDPDAVPLSQPGELWHLQHALCDACPGMALVLAETEGWGLRPLEDGVIIPTIVPVGSDRCYGQVHGIAWQGWVLTHLGVHPEAEFGAVAIAHLREQIARDQLRCEHAQVEIAPLVLAQPPVQDADNLEWVSHIRAEAEALRMDHATPGNGGQRTSPRL